MKLSKRASARGEVWVFLILTAMAATEIRGATTVVPAFAPQVRYSVAVGDLTNTGNFDLVTANSGSNDISVLINQSAQPTPTPVPLITPTPVPSPNLTPTVFPTPPPVACGGILCGPGVIPLFTAILLGWGLIRWVNCSGHDRRGRTGAS